MAKKHFEALDGLRGVAAIVVVVSHLGEALGRPLLVSHAHLAVDFFFLLSGYVIGYAYDDRWGGMALGAFFRRRLQRLHPLVPLGVALGFVPALLANFNGLADQPWWVIALVALAASLMIPTAGFGAMNPFNGPNWTLTYEYVANVLYATVFRRMGRRTLAVCVALAACLSIAFALRIDLFGLLPKYGYTFKCGWRFSAVHCTGAMTRLLFPFLAGLLMCRAGLRIRTRNFFWPGALAMVVLLLMPMFGEGWIEPTSAWNGVYELGVVLVAFPLLLACGVGDETADGPTLRLAKFLGAISYPLYMTHYPFAKLTHWLYAKGASPWPDGAVALYVVGFVALAVGFAWLVMTCYCNPIARFFARRGKKEVSA